MAREGQRRRATCGKVPAARCWEQAVPTGSREPAVAHRVLVPPGKIWNPRQAAPLCRAKKPERGPDVGARRGKNHGVVAAVEAAARGANQRKAPLSVASLEGTSQACAPLTGGKALGHALPPRLRQRSVHSDRFGRQGMRLRARLLPPPLLTLTLTGWARGGTRRRSSCSARPRWLPADAAARAKRCGASWLADSCRRPPSPSNRPMPARRTPPTARVARRAGGLLLLLPEQSSCRGPAWPPAPKAAGAARRPAAARWRRILAPPQAAAGRTAAPVWSSGAMAGACCTASVAAAVPESGGARASPAGARWREQQAHPPPAGPPTGGGCQPPAPACRPAPQKAALRKGQAGACARGRGACRARAVALPPGASRGAG